MPALCFRKQLFPAIKMLVAGRQAGMRAERAAVTGMFAEQKFDVLYVRDVALFLFLVTVK